MTMLQFNMLMAMIGASSFERLLRRPEPDDRLVEKWKEKKDEMK
jgi:hypothetical protein